MVDCTDQGDKCHQENDEIGKQISEGDTATMAMGTGSKRMKARRNRKFI